MMIWNGVFERSSTMSLSHGTLLREDTVTKGGEKDGKRESATKGRRSERYSGERE